MGRGNYKYTPIVDVHCTGRKEPFNDLLRSRLKLIIKLFFNNINIHKLLPFVKEFFIKVISICVTRHHHEEVTYQMSCRILSAR